MTELTLEPYAARLGWRFAQAQALERWQALFAALFDELALACTAGGSRHIGHIKGLALLPGGGYLRASKVSASYPADVEVEGATTPLFAGLELDLNVLVYGLPLAEAEHLVSQTGRTLARRWGVELEVMRVSAGPVGR